MRAFDGAKQIYKMQIPPDELTSRLESEIARAREREKRGGFGRGLRRMAGVLAACLAVFILLLNTSSSFAMAASRIPVLGAVARVLTIRVYEEETPDQKIHAEVPQVVPGQDAAPEIKDYTERINALIQEKVDDYIEVSRQRVQEYKQAFLETGGTEEEFEEHDITSSVTYELKYQEGARLSFVVYASENWASAYTENSYYNLDLESGRELTLKDILGEDYQEAADRSIRSQMEERIKEDPDYMYFDKDMGGYQGVTEETKFYLNEKGNPVIVFAKYEIAPGFMGEQEFEVPVK